MSDESPASTPEPKAHDWRHLLYPVLAALLTALASLLQSCTPAQVAKADRAFEKAQAELACAHEVERTYGDLAVEPEAATLSRAQAALKALKACASSQDADAVEDAGSR